MGRQLRRLHHGQLWVGRRRRVEQDGAHLRIAGLLRPWGMQQCLQGIGIKYLAHFQPAARQAQMQQPRRVFGVACLHGVLQHQQLHTAVHGLHTAAQTGAGRTQAVWTQRA